MFVRRSLRALNDFVTSLTNESFQILAPEYQNIKLLDIECDCCNVEFNIGVNTVVIINGGETQSVTRNFSFFLITFLLLTIFVCTN